MKTFVALLAVAMLSGCSARQIEVAESTATRTEQGLATAQTAVEFARARVQDLETTGLADPVTIERAKSDLALAEQALTAAQEAARMAQASLKAARAARDAGGSWLDIAAGIGGALVPAAGGVFLAWRRMRQAQQEADDIQADRDRHRAALVAATALADKLKEASGSASITGILAQARAEQTVNGVRDLINEVRKEDTKCSPVNKS